MPTTDDLSLVPSDEPSETERRSMRARLREVFSDPRLSCVDRSVWFMLSAHADDSNVAWPHAITLAIGPTGLGLHPKTVEQSLRKLRECGLIRRFRNERGRIKWSLVVDLTDWSTIMAAPSPARPAPPPPKVHVYKSGSQRVDCVCPEEPMGSRGAHGLLAEEPMGSSVGAHGLHVSDDMKRRHGKGGGAPAEVAAVVGSTPEPVPPPPPLAAHEVPAGPGRSPEAALVERLHVLAGLTAPRTPSRQQLRGAADLLALNTADALAETCTAALKVRPGLAGKVAGLCEWPVDLARIEAAARNGARPPPTAQELADQAHRARVLAEERARKLEEDAAAVQLDPERQAAAARFLAGRRRAMGA